MRLAELRETGDETSMHSTLIYWLSTTKLLLLLAMIPTAEAISFCG